MRVLILCAPDTEQALFSVEASKRHILIHSFIICLDKGFCVGMWQTGTLKRLTCFIQFNSTVDLVLDWTE